MSNIRSVDTTVLAYIGDAVYELYVRRQVMAENRLMKAGSLHKISVCYVSSEAQARALKGIESLLTEDEKDIVRRARNKKSISRPRCATPLEYKLSTAFEALIGYLYMKQDQTRVEQIMKQAMTYLDINRPVAPARSEKREAIAERDERGHE